MFQSAEATDADLSQLALDPAAVKLLFTAARTANSFSDEPVDDSQLGAITELARWPPTMGSSNPLRVLFIRTPAGKRRLEPFMSEGNRAKTMSAPVVAVLATDTEFHEKLRSCCPSGPRRASSLLMTQELRERLAIFNGALQSGYFILAIRAAGLAAGPMLGFDADGIDAEFFAGRPYKTILVINLGKPGENPWFDRLPRLARDYVEYE